MNERIRLLAEQAGIELPNNVVDGVNGPGVVSEKDKLAKFAELIVKDIHAYVDSLDTAQIISNGILKRYGVDLLETELFAAE